MRQALIVAHGWPKHPAIVEAELAWIAARTSALLPDWAIRSATLAAPRSLENAIARTDPGDPLLIYPYFMSDGWFVSNYLRKRAKACEPRELVWCTPLGLDKRVRSVCQDLLDYALNGVSPGEATLVVVAHGSPDNPRPAEIARNLTDWLASDLGFRASRTGFVDEPPFLEEVLRVEGPAVCLPFFATRAGHIREDLAEALKETGFKGPVTPPVGTVDAAPRLVAEALTELAETGT